MPDITPTTAGQDLVSTDQKYDAHIRLETRRYPPSGPAESHTENVISVDVFDSAYLDPNAAHIDTAAFPWGNGGALHATEFLRTYGFGDTVRFR